MSSSARGSSAEDKCAATLEIQAEEEPRVGKGLCVCVCARARAHVCEVGGVDTLDSEASDYLRR